MYNDKGCVSSDSPPQHVLDDLLSQGQEGGGGGGGKVRTLHLSTIPDTLYMLEEGDATLSEPYSGSPVSTVDVIAGTIPGEFPSCVLRCTSLQRIVVGEYFLGVFSLFLVSRINFFGEILKEGHLHFVVIFRK